MPFTTDATGAARAGAPGFLIGVVVKLAYERALYQVSPWIRYRHTRDVSRCAQPEATGGID